MNSNKDLFDLDLYLKFQNQTSKEPIRLLTVTTSLSLTKPLTTAMEFSNCKDLTD